jgi:hypothetical protein
MQVPLRQSITISQFFDLCRAASQLTRPFSHLSLDHGSFRSSAILQIFLALSQILLVSLSVAIHLALKERGSWD